MTPQPHLQQLARLHCYPNLHAAYGHGKPQERNEYDIKGLFYPHLEHSFPNELEFTSSQQIKVQSINEVCPAPSHATHLLKTLGVGL